MGNVPMSAAMVVIIMGRKRTRQASWMASAGENALRVLDLQREVDHHDGVLLHDPNQHDDAHERVDVELVVEYQERGQSAQAGRGPGRERM